MSTAFEVYPGQLSVPTFAELTQLAERRLHEFTSGLGVETRLRLRSTLRTQLGREETWREAVGPFRGQPGERTYAWFEIVGSVGGCDVEYSEDRGAIEVFRDEIKFTQTLPGEFVDRCLDLGRSWAFRRSAGNPCLITLAYGYLAAALAELASGFIYSADGAWDRDALPMSPDSFYASYFRACEPEKSREWDHHACIAELEAELAALG